MLNSFWWGSKVNGRVSKTLREWRQAQQCKVMTQKSLSFVGKTLREWRQAQQCKVMTQKSLEMPDSMPIRWNKPPYNWTKLNVDAAIFNNGSSTGLGCILRDHEGTFLAARSVNKQIRLQPREAKALSVREALHWIRIQSLSNVIVEMDSLLVFQANTSSGRASQLPL